MTVGKFIADWNETQVSSCALELSASAARKVQVIAAVLVGLVTLVGADVIENLSMSKLLTCILMVSALPQEARSLVRPLLDTILFKDLLAVAASELQEILKLASQDEAVQPITEPWIYAVGCLASEIQQAIDALVCACQSEESHLLAAKGSVQYCQWVARLYLSRSAVENLGTCGTPSRKSCASSHRLSILSARSRSVESHAEKVSCAGATMSSRNSEASVQSGEEERDDDHCSVESVLSSSDEDEHVSDLEDFIDFGTEFNSHGFLASLDDAGAERNVQSFFAMEISPSWQDGCNEVMDSHNIGHPTTSALTQQLPEHNLEHSRSQHQPPHRKRQRCL